MCKVLSFGELLWDDYGDRQIIGGAPFNYAAHCSQLGLNVAFLTAVGKDALGEKSLEQIRKFKVSTQFVQEKDDFPTGITAITFNGDVPSYELLQNTAYDNVTADENLIAEIKNFSADCFYFGTVGQRGAVSQKTLEKIIAEINFNTIFCDINFREGNIKPSAVENCLKYANIIKISREEAHYLWDYGFIAEMDLNHLAKTLKLKFPNIKKLVITLDKDGALGFDFCEDKEYKVEAYPCEFVSPVGAGDSFSAAVTCELLKDTDFETALKKASKLASFVVSSKEAIPEYINF